MELSYSLANAIMNDGVTIQIPAGTTFSMTIKITKNGTPYRLFSGDIIAFGAKRSLSETSFVIYKELTSNDYSEDDGGYVLTLDTSDTNISAMRYYYDIGLKTSTGDFYKIVPTSFLKVTENVVNEEDVGNDS